MCSLHGWLMGGKPAGLLASSHPCEHHPSASRAVSTTLAYCSRQQPIACAIAWRLRRDMLACVWNWAALLDGFVQHSLSSRALLICSLSCHHALRGMNSALLLGGWRNHQCMPLASHPPLRVLPPGTPSTVPNHRCNYPPPPLHNKHTHTYPAACIQVPHPHRVQGCVPVPVQQPAPQGAAVCLPRAPVHVHQDRGPRPASLLLRPTRAPAASIQERPRRR